MPLYQHPLTEDVLLELGFEPVKHMACPTYSYEKTDTYTHLELRYEDGQYVIADPRLGMENVEYFRGEIKTADILKNLIVQHSGNERGRTELGREIQDADFITTTVNEDERGSFISGRNLRWYKVSKLDQTYKVEFDRDHAGFEKATDVLGEFDSLRDAVTAIYKH